MKRIIILLFVLVVANIVMAQWQLISFPPYMPPDPNNCTYLNGCGTVASNNRYFWVQNINCAAGGMGQYYLSMIWRTLNVVPNWVWLSDENGTITKIEFISADTGYYIQYDVDIEEKIYKTCDGLNSRQLCNYTGLHNYLAVEMLSYNQLIAIDKDAYIYHLENDTLKVICHLPYDFEYVYRTPITATENQTLFLALKTYDGSQYVSDIILRSMDGGYLWDTSFISTSIHINELSFSSDSIGMAVADSGIILRTQNGGNTWTGINSGETNNLISVDYMNNEVWIIGGTSGIIVYTADGGENWETLLSPSIYDVIKVYFPQKDSTLIIHSWHFYKTTIDLLTSVSVQKSQAQFRLFPNPVKEYFTISSTSITDNTQLSIFNVSGEKLLEKQLTDTETQLDISALPRGVYFVRIQNENMVEVAKFIKE